MKKLIVFTYLGCCVFHSSVVQSQCVAPPMECPNKNITFWLYTRENENKGHQITVNDSESIEHAPWVRHAPIKILIHGYTGDKDYSPNTEIRPAYLKCCDYNIISVDYNPIAREPCYMEAARNTELVGKCTAQLICDMVNHYGFKLKQFHVIGFSLGGQTAGFIGNYLSCGRLDRITALDPAMPLFVTPDINKKVDKSDANFVDVLHTNALEKGKLEASGDLDFYANGGISQPGCKATAEQSFVGFVGFSIYNELKRYQKLIDTKQVSLDLTESLNWHVVHYKVLKIQYGECNIPFSFYAELKRAPIYFAESILTDVGFYATKCHTWITYMIGWCELFNSSDDILFGEYVPWNATGTYFFSTNDKPPYAKGPNKKQKRSVKLSRFSLKNILF